MKDLGHIQRISRVMQAASWLSLLLVGLSWLWLGLMPEAWIPVAARQTGLVIDASGIQMPQQVIVVLVLLLPFATLAYGLWRLQALFGLYAQGTFFTRANIQALRAFAGSLAIAALLSPLVSGLLSVVLTWNNPPGQKALHISFGSQQGLLLLIGGAFWVIAWIMGEAKKIADENAEII